MSVRQQVSLARFVTDVLAHREGQTLAVLTPRMSGSTLRRKLQNEAVFTLFSARQKTRRPKKEKSQSSRYSVLVIDEAP